MGSIGCLFEHIVATDHFDVDATNEMPLGIHWNPLLSCLVNLLILLRFIGSGDYIGFKKSSYIVIDIK